jgi:hypothetical protein
MKIFSLILFACLASAASAASAQTSSSGLDLSLPDTTRFGTPYVPPGTVVDDGTPQIGDETDDGKAHVHGSFTTGFGHVEGLGSTSYNAAHINVTKAFGEDRDKHMSFDLNVETSRGPGLYGYGRRYSRRDDPWSMDASETPLPP